MTNSNWKGFERKVARKFYGVRIIRPDWGKNDLDVLAKPFGIECKYRKDVSYNKALEQVELIIETVQEREGLLPLAVVQRVGTRGKEEVVFRLKTLQKLGLMREEVDIAEDIWVVPLDRFLETLRHGGVKYGRPEKNGAVEGSGK